MKRFFLAFAVTCLAVSETQALPISLLTDFPAGTPLVVNAGNVSGPMTFSLTNGSVPDAPIDFLSGWLVDLQIVGLAGATGLTFNTPAPSATTTSLPNPASYVLTPAGAAANGILANVPNTGPNAGIVASVFDFTFPLTGVQVPLTGANLFVADFLAAPFGSAGTYNVVAQTFPSTEWTDSNGLTGTQQPFINDPGTPFVIGQVVVTPEPGSVCVWLGLLVCAGLARRRSDRAMSF